MSCFLFENVNNKNNKCKQECIPVGCVPPAHWLYLRVSSYPMHTPLEQPRMPPRATMHPPEQPHTPRATTIFLENNSQLYFRRKASFANSNRLQQYRKAELLFFHINTLTLIAGAEIHVSG